MNYKLAAIDLDDTLLGPDKIVSQENAKAVQRLRDAGIHVCLASGRRHENMARFHNQLGLHGPIVSCNGALVKDMETGDVLWEKRVPADLAAEIVRDGIARGITQNYYHTDGSVYVRETNHWTNLYQTRTDSLVTIHPNLLDLTGDAPLKILWINTPDVISELQEDLAARYVGRLYVTTTDPEYVEFMAMGVSKAVGMEVVANRMHISQNEVIAFGDSSNDVPMLAWAGLGIAVGHARPGAVAAAKRVGPPGNPETALARAVDMVLNET